MRLSEAIVFALSYADIFDYPYTIEELCNWLPGRWSTPKVQDALKILMRGKRVNKYGEFYCLTGRREIVAIRKSRRNAARRKMKIARYAASVLGRIPSVMLIGVTGGLSQGNADRADDIDFFIATQPGTVWVTRMVCTVLMEWFGMRRRPDAKQVEDKICLNMFVSRDGMGIPKKERDMYTAHEVLQLVPLFERSAGYQAFLFENQWVSGWFPLQWDSVRRFPNAPLTVSGGRMDTMLIALFRLTEKFVKRVQLWYMHSRRTTEIVSDRIIRFHPNDARIWITTGLRNRGIRTIPLDNKNIRP